jgi:hypothetical protein
MSNNIINIENFKLEEVKDVAIKFCKNLFKTISSHDRVDIKPMVRTNAKYASVRSYFSDKMTEMFIIEIDSNLFRSRKFDNNKFMYNILKTSISEKSRIFLETVDDYCLKLSKEDINILKTKNDIIKPNDEFSSLFVQNNEDITFKLNFPIKYAKKAPTDIQAESLGYQTRIFINNKEEYPKIIEDLLKIFNNQISAKISIYISGLKHDTKFNPRQPIKFEFSARIISVTKQVNSDVLNMNLEKELFEKMGISLSNIEINDEDIHEESLIENNTSNNFINKLTDTIDNLLNNE